MTGLLAAVRAIHLASLMAIFGGGAYVVLLRRATLAVPPVKPARILFVTAATLALVSGIGWFCLIAGQMSGDWASSVDPTTLLAALGTRFGRIFLGRFVGLAALWSMCVFARSPAFGITILAGILLALLGPISHAAASGSDIALIGATNDAMHLLAAGFWLGGLIVLALLMPGHLAQPTELLGPLRLFSTWGSFVVALLVATGLANAVWIVPASALSLHNPYFRLLVVKVGLAVAMIVLAVLNRWYFAPRLRNGGDHAVRSLAGSVHLEIAFGFTVVAIAGFLGLMAPH